MKAKILFVLSIFFICKTTLAQNATNPQVIFELSFAQVINQPSSGYNFGVYYKTKWPIAARLGFTHVFTGDGFNQFMARYLQIGYMQEQNKWSYHALAGILPGEGRLWLPHVSGGFGYLLRERPGKNIKAVLQLNYAKNRLEEKFWMHLGFHLGFNEKTKTK
jgi:hypothetical protein